MTLLELDAELLRYEEWDQHVYHKTVLTFEKAHGVMFLCPACFAAHGGPRGTHSVVCWSRSRGVPERARPGPGRWRMDGTGLHDLTLNAEAPGGARSVQLLGGCNWHGYVTAGQVTNA